MGTSRERKVVPGIAMLTGGLALLFPGASCSSEVPAPIDAGASARTDVEVCVLDLVAGGALLQKPQEVMGIETPVQIGKKLGPLSLIPRGTYPALMDCTLALALQKAAPIFEATGLTELHFSAAYDHRTRRGSSQLSSHAFGRAIDVHSFAGVAGPHDVATHFEPGVGTWIGLSPHDGALEECIGNPTSEPGRTLRVLVCRLKLETDLRIIVTPDDNEAHRDHVHLEYAPPRASRGPRPQATMNVAATHPPVVKKSLKPKAKKNTARIKARVRAKRSNRRK